MAGGDDLPAHDGTKGPGSAEGPYHGAVVHIDDIEVKAWPRSLDCPEGEQYSEGLRFLDVG